LALLKEDQNNFTASIENQLSPLCLLRQWKTDTRSRLPNI
jgi:hypothetical protein